MLWQPGLILNDTYRIDRQFDGGGFGVVYQATDRRQNRTVAIKTLNPTQISGDRFQAEQVKFINEAMKLAKFQHRHIVEVFEVVESGGVFGMVMEFVKGQNLGECLQQRGKPFRESVALGYVQQVGEALALLHDRGMLHRDIKPLNIMQRASKRDEAVLIDFGLARELEFGVTQTFTNAGTPAYAAPEQFRQARSQQVKPGAYTDVYGLAATLYALLTNQNPFPAEFRLQGIPLIAPRQHNGAVSERVSRAIVRGMELEPSKRSATVAEFLSDLGLGQSQKSQPQKSGVPAGEPELRSTKGVSYRKLRDLLKAGKWKEADRETADRMLEVAGRTEEGWLDPEHIDNFPCEDLRTIDQLWVHFSKGKFGFSIQVKIYRELGGTRKFDEVWEKFGDRVGWRVGGHWLSDSDLTFNTPALHAHLPLLECGFGWGLGWNGLGLVVSSLAQRLVDCNR